MSAQQEYKEVRGALDAHLKGNGAFKFKSWIVAIVVMCAALLWPFLSQAASFELASGVYTEHLEEYNTERNENNDLIAFNYRFTDSDWGVLATTFTNSYDIKTNALAVTYSVIKWRAVELELVLGLMKG